MKRHAVSHTVLDSTETRRRVGAVEAPHGATQSATFNRSTTRRRCR